MADSKISALTAVTTPAGTDEFAVNQGGTSKKMTLAQVINAGALALLEEHTASSSGTLDFTTCISAAFDDYLIEIIDLIPATNGVNLHMRMGTGAGPTFDTGANYGYASYEWRAGGGATGGYEGGQAQIALIRNTQTTTANWGLSGSLHLMGPGSALYKMVFGKIMYFLSPYRLMAECMGSYESTTAVTGLRFYYSSGNIASGTIRVYGLAKS